MNATKTAALVTAVVIALSAFLGCNRSLAQYRHRVAGAIVTGDDHGNCIADDCQELADTGRNLLTVAKKYLPAGDDAIAELDKALGRMDRAGTDAGTRRNAAAAIRENADKVLRALGKTGAVAPKDQAYLAGFADTMDGCLHRMETDAYNAAAEGFNSLEKSFPANVLGVFVGPLDTFDFAH